MEGKISYLYLFMLSLAACEDPFRVPSSISNEGILVVEGRIGDQQTTVKLSETSNLDSLVINMVSNAVITLEDEAENTLATLSEIEEGSYVVDLALSVGAKYRIRIETADDDIYESEYVEILETPAISELSTKLDISDFRLDILLDTEDPTNNTRYYQWEYEETFQYNPAFESLFKYENDELVLRASEDQIDDCWKTEESTNILLGTSIALGEDVISDQLITSHVLTRNQKFSVGYSINVKQYALSQDEFQFWTLLETNSEDLGTLFDPQPSQLSSNLSCISDPNKNVVGYIGASSVVERRIFVTRRDLPDDIPLFRYNCVSDTLDRDRDLINQKFSSGAFIPICYAVIEIEQPPGLDTFGVKYSTRFCTDCREQGGTRERPSFWF